MVAKLHPMYNYSVVVCNSQVSVTFVIETDLEGILVSRNQDCIEHTLPKKFCGNTVLVTTYFVTKFRIFALSKINLIIPSFTIY